MDNKKITIGVLVAITAVFGVLAFKAPSVVTIEKTVPSLGSEKPVVNVPAPVVNVQVPEQPRPIVNVTVPTPKPTVLGAASYDFSSNYFSVGGVKTYAWTDNVDATASTSCSFGPIVATSTLVRASAFFTNLATSTRVQIGVGTTAYATTTSLGAGDMPTGGGLLVASTSAFAVLNPGDYVNVKQGNGSTAGTTDRAGKCQLVVQQVN